MHPLNIDLSPFPRLSRNLFPHTYISIFAFMYSRFCSQTGVHIIKKKLPLFFTSFSFLSFFHFPALSYYILNIRNHCQRLAREYVGESGVVPNLPGLKVVFHVEIKQNQSCNLCWRFVSAADGFM